MKTIKTMINAMASRWRNSVPPQEKQGAGTNELSPLWCTIHPISAIVSRDGPRSYLRKPAAIDTRAGRLDSRTVDRESRASNPRSHDLARATRQLEFVKHPADECINARPD